METEQAEEPQATLPLQPPPPPPAPPGGEDRGGPELKEQELGLTEKPQQQQQQQPTAPPTPWPPPKLQALPAGRRALIGRSYPSGTWWFGAWDDGERGEEEMRESDGDRDWLHGQRPRGFWERAGWSTHD